MSTILNGNIWVVPFQDETGSFLKTAFDAFIQDDILYHLLSIFLTLIFLVTFFLNFHLGKHDGYQDLRVYFSCHLIVFDFGDTQNPGSDISGQIVGWLVFSLIVQHRDVCCETCRHFL